MDVDGHRLFHLRQIRPIAIGSDHLPVATFPTDVQLSSDLLAHHADLRSAIDEDGKFVPVYLFKNGWRDPGVLEFGVSGVIFQAGEGRTMRDSDFLRYSWGSSSNSFDRRN